MRALVFDIDNTLTPPRRPLSAAMAAALSALRLPFHLAAGSDLPLVQQQLIAPLHEFKFRGSFDAFVSNGAHRCRCTLGDEVRIDTVSAFVLRQHLGDAEYEQLLQCLQAALDDPRFAIAEPGLDIVGPRLIDRRAMINLAPIGRPPEMDDAAFRNRAAFVAFDRRTGYRGRLMAHLRQQLQRWQPKGLRVTLGGQTSFDIVVAGYDKRHPLQVLLQEGYSRLTYFGDALHEGGNDAAVLEWIREWQGDAPCPVDVVQVQGWQDTLDKLRQMELLDA
jgi:hydroxymethylpyrimidine pyrophosphatase-like HAD family hydrolase